MSAAVEMIGLTFGRLRVAASAGYREGARRKGQWECICECGNKVVVVGERLRSGHTTSCGCYRNQRQSEANVKHGFHGTPEYFVWKQMWQRCTNSKVEAFPHYGARGISVCERWRDFAAFLTDMGPRPSPDHQIDRRDNDGNYEPGNCRWATRVQQAANTSQAILIDVNGSAMTVGAACRATGLGRKIVLKRFRRLDAEERAVRTQD